MFKKLIFFCPSIEEGGVEKNLIILINNLVKKYDLTLITANSNKKKLFNSKIKFLSPKFLKIENMPRIFKSTCCFFLAIFSKNLIKKKSIIISFESNIFAIILSKVLKKKIIVRSNLSPNGYLNNSIKKNIFKFFFNFADKIIVNSHDFKKQIDRILNIKSDVLNNSILSKKEIFKLSNKKIKKINVKKNTYKLISVGRLVEQKDHLTLLKALNLLKNDLSFYLIIIGKGRLKYQLQKFCLKNELNDKIKFIGYKSNIFPYLKWSDALILSSVFEGLPNVLLEAISMNKLAISSDCPTGPREILINGKAGFLYKTSDYKDLSRKIKYSYKNKKISEKKINIAYKSLYKYDYKKNINQFLKIIDKIK